MDRTIQSIPARDVDGGTDNQDDEDHQGFMSRKRNVSSSRFFSLHSITVERLANILLINPTGTFIEELFMNELCSKRKREKNRF